MSAGDKWTLPNGQQALELEGSTAAKLRVCIIQPNWPFPAPPVWVSRKSCVSAPMRYHKGAVMAPKDEAPF